MKAALVVVSLLAILVVAVVGGQHVWTAIEGSSISIHGFIALGLGALATFGLGAGLMFLVFYSSRRGYDDIEIPPPPPPERDNSKR